MGSLQSMANVNSNWYDSDEDDDLPPADISFIAGTRVEVNLFGHNNRLFARVEVVEVERDGHFKTPRVIRHDNRCFLLFNGRYSECTFGHALREV